MNDRFRFGFLICLFLSIGVFSAGCSGESADSPVIPVATTLSVAKFAAGDIIAKSADGSDEQLYIIMKYDASKDEYERAWIYRNSDGTWGHFVDRRTDRGARKIIEKVYPITVGHITVSAIPVITPTVVTPVPAPLSGNAPTVTAIIPMRSARDMTVPVTITGTNFQTGAIPRLIQPGSPAITANGVSVAATKIECSFNLAGKEAGSYNVVVTNPDGQSGSLQRAFTIGDAAPIISGVSPNTLSLNESISLVITGQNFKEGVKVTLVRDSSEIPCVSPVSTGGTRITCDLDLSTKKFTMEKTGDWDVRVLNIEGSQSGSWTKKFSITNTTV